MMLRTILLIVVISASSKIIAQEDLESSAPKGWRSQIGLATDFSLGNLNKFSVLPYLSLKSPEKTVQWNTFFGFNYLRFGGQGENRDVDWINQLNFFPEWKFQPNILLSLEHSTLLNLDFRGLYGLGISKDLVDDASTYLQVSLFGVAEHNNWAFFNRRGDFISREFWLTGPIGRVNGIHYLWDDRVNIMYDWLGFFPLNRRIFRRMITTLSINFEIANQFSFLIMANMTNEGWTPPGIRKNNLYASFGLAWSGKR